MSNSEDLSGFDQGYEIPLQGGYESNYDLENRIESLILQVGEKITSTIKNDLEGLICTLDLHDFSNFKKKIIKILVYCAINMPEKCTIYSTIVGLLNAKNYNFGRDFVETIVSAFKDSLKSYSWNEAKVLLRFIGDLVNCHVVSVNSFVRLLGSLLDVTKEDGVPNVGKDWYCYVVLSCLPWVGRKLNEKKQLPLEMLLTTIEVYMNKRPKNYIDMLLNLSTEIIPTQEEYLERLWNQIKKLKHDRWSESIIQRPYLTFDNDLCEALQHNLPAIIPPSYYNARFYPMPWVVYRITGYIEFTDGHIMLDAHSIERFQEDEHIKQIIDMSLKNSKECSTIFMHFVHKVPLENCFEEVVFNLILYQPKPKHFEISYDSVLKELFILLNNTKPHVLANILDILYSQIEFMHVCAFTRCVLWFAFHLCDRKSNWLWQNCVEWKPEHPKSLFVREVFQKAMCMSNHEHMRNIALPPHFEQFLPEKPEPKFKYIIENSLLPGQFLSNTLKTKILSGTSAEDIIEILTNPLMLEDGKIMEPAVSNPIKIDAFIQTLLYTAGKTFNHAFAAITKYISVFWILGQTDDSQLQILQSTFDLWSANQEMLTELIDEMIKRQIVECSSVAKWIFSKEMIPEFTKLYIWEILSLTIDKMSEQVDRFTRELNEAREKFGITSSTLSSSDNYDQSATFVILQVPMDIGDYVTEAMVERMEDKLDTALAHHKNLFSIVFQKFIIILSEHLEKCYTDNTPFDTYWYKYRVGRLEQVILAHHGQVQNYICGLKQELFFNQHVDIRILDVFNQFIIFR